ncbi:hypothetical protein [Schleiferilactobacillus perolens]|uniref:Uncharacterized protein n=1 Tax=Schleiferilactobacillus perolens DSM 12744 TaxID=1423792 RepID=A0A0R1N5F3_9LACO|nr:hypothetical protein [Schleiferilactobacillus perolens]KRL13045.1 hypothetical protein FD09_GL002585 [Schleiferilactobacillus perolens DSM 12744]
MEKQIEELLRLLNQGVKQLPQSLNIIVQQYALRKWMIGSVFAVMVVILGVASFVCLRQSMKIPAYEKRSVHEDSMHFMFVTIASIAAILAFILLMASLSSFADAISPVYSLIQDLR